MDLKHLFVLFLLEIVPFSLGKQCVGCPNDIEVNNLAVYNYLSKKLHDLKNVIPKGTSHDREFELVQVKNAQEQVVAGIQHSYQFEARGMKTNQLYDCNLIVLKQSWIGKEKVTEYSCNLLTSNENRRPFFGEEIPIDVNNNNELEELSPFISQEIGKAQHAEYVMIVTKYLNATIQIVAGMLIKATVEVGITNCRLENDTTNTGCQQIIQGHQVCEVQLWLKPWMKFKLLTELQCQPLQPMLGMCVGCPIDKDPNDPLIRHSLEKALYKLNKESLSSPKLTLVKINKATSQVINGYKLTIYFNAQEVDSTKTYACKTVIILLPSLSEEQTVKNFNCNPISAN